MADRRSEAAAVIDGPGLEATHASTVRRAGENFLLACISAFVIALQITYIRALSIASYHHFVYLVVSTALLGFGAGGTLLAILGDRADDWYEVIALLALAGFAVGAPWALRLSAAVPIDLYYMLYSFREAARLWLATLLLTVPFFAGGLFIGAVLRRHRARSGTSYAANLIGSGIGGVGALPLLGVASPEGVAAWIGVASAAILVAWSFAVGGTLKRTEARRQVARIVLVAAATGISAAAILIPWEQPVDQYKGLAFARRLAEQDDASRVATVRSPTARTDVYDAPSMHYTLFASPGAPTPPPQLQLFRDGFLRGALFQIDDPEDADILDWLPQSLPYRLLASPDVLILGETSGVNVWLALRNGASSVTVVTRDQELVELMTGSLARRGGSVFQDDRVTVIVQDPRTALAGIEARFDLIHLADTEGIPAAGAGLVSLQEDFLLTREGISGGLSRLSPGGLLTATRGIQSPPRDNLRMFALFVSALRERGVASVDRHLLQARNYLAATTVVSADPLDSTRTDAFIAAADRLVMDVDYFPGVRDVDLTERNRVEGPPGAVGSYFYHAAEATVSGELESFADGWLYRIEPPTDNRPYFHNFFTLSSLRRYIDVYGQFWFSRVELGPVVVAVTLIQSAIAAVALILLPILVRRRPVTASDRPPTGWTLLHFGLIGFGFMALEMLFIQRGVLIVGDPIYSAAATITGILVWAGVGSAAQERSSRLPRERIVVAGLAVVGLGAATFALMGVMPEQLARASEGMRFLVLLGLLGPVSFAMGWLFPAGIARLTDRGGEVGLALAMNGVASVVAAPAAVLISSSAGFPVVLLVAVGCYAVVAAAALRLHS